MGRRSWTAGIASRRKKAILLAIIDDHTRMIVGAQFGFFENTKLIEWVFKDAILAHGLPDRLYCDNGAIVLKPVPVASLRTSEYWARAQQAL